MIKKNRFGFTLMELIMVVVIVIVAGLIIGPRLVNFLTAWDLEVEAKKLRAKIRDARQLAVTKQTTSRIEFNLDNESYVIKYYDSITSTFIEVDPDTFEPLDLGEDPTVYLKNNIEINSTTFTLPALNTVDFDSFGAPDPLGGNIVLEDTEGILSTVGIGTATGRVTIQRIQ